MKHLLATVRIFGVALLLAAAVAGCHDDVKCCPIEAPICGCFSIGGAARSGTCQRICDAAPTNWRRTTDQNGCPVLVQDTVVGSCLPQPPRDGATDGDSATDGADDGGGER
jgi:hypothetical protein